MPHEGAMIVQLV